MLRYFSHFMVDFDSELFLRFFFALGQVIRKFNALLLSTPSKTSVFAFSSDIPSLPEVIKDFTRWKKTLSTFFADLKKKFFSIPSIVFPYSRISWENKLTFFHVRRFAILIFFGICFFFCWLFFEIDFRQFEKLTNFF